MSNDWYCLKDILEIVSEIIGEPLLDIFLFGVQMRINREGYKWKT